MSEAVFDKIRDLDAQKATLVEEAKEAALGKARAAIEALNELGFDYRLAREDELKKAGGRGGSRKARADQDCAVCGFQTIPPHDGRAHRHQIEKLPFSEEELAQRGLVRAETGSLAESSLGIAYSDPEDGVVKEG